MKDIEDRVRAYQPASPPPDLRARVLDPASRPIQPRSRGVLEWTPAMAAAAAALIFALMAQRAQADVSRRMPEQNAGHAEAVSALRDALGGNDLARAEAERIVSEEEQRSRDTALTTETQLEPNGHE